MTVIKVLCDVPPPTSWSGWCDRDDPTGDYDFERLREVRESCKDVCANPIAAECRTVDDHTPSSETGQILQVACTPDGGLICSNADNNLGQGPCKDYEVRFLCPPDINECNTPDICDANARCENTHGGYNCICNEGFIGDGQTCYEGAKCTTWENHFIQFDNENFDYDGSCSYQLAKPCQDIGTTPLFSVVAKPFKVEDDSITKSVVVRVYNDFRIKFINSVIYVNDVQRSVPYRIQPVVADLPESYITILSFTGGVELQTEFGLRVASYTGGVRIDVFVPTALQGNMCGLCGDYDGNMDNNFKLDDGTRTADPIVFGQNMEVADNDASCNANTDPGPPCSEEQLAAAAEKCNLMIDQRFGQCLMKIGSAVQFFVQNCLDDVCKTPSKICTNMEAYSEECAQAGVPIVWRDLFPECPLQCGANSHYEPMGPTCPTSCTGEAGSCSLPYPVMEGCQCDSGYILSGETCIHEATECGCTHNMKYYKVYEKFFDVDCSAECTCTGPGIIDCDNTVVCHELGECVSQADGSADCKCKEGFMGSGLDCTDKDECSQSDHQCHEKARCINEHGGYSCVCQAGYNGDGYECTDVNECTDGTEQCSPHSTCGNEAGTYTCICDEGYMGDGSGRLCVEIIPEEPAVPEDCDPFQEEQCMECADCRPLPHGNFVCICPASTMGDGMKGEGHTGCSMPQCSEGWINYDDGCYTVIDKPKPFDDANKECQMHGGELASITDAATVNFLRSHMETMGNEGQFWIGYTDANMEGVFVWSDNTASDYTKWAPGEPSSETDSSRLVKDCVAMGDVTQFEFVTRRCDLELGFVCRKPLQLKKCPRGWMLREGECYMRSEEPGSWMDAYIKCVAHGADLASITDGSELNFIKEQVIPGTDGIDLWIGATRRFVDDGSPVFKWTDFSDVQFINWAEGEPVSSTDEQCVLANNMMKWSAVSCDQQLGFICKKSVNKRDCGPGAMELNGKCVQIYPTAQDCMDFRTMPLTIPNGFVQQAVVRYLQSQPALSNPIIGYIEGPQDVFTWIDGSTSTYTNWANAEPNSAGSSACTAMRSDLQYQWDDVECADSSVGPVLCYYDNVPCANEDECGENEQCFMGRCTCREGFKGHSGHCQDVDECSKPENPCGEGLCVNRDGAYDCMCQDGYVQSGDTCTPVTACTTDADCHTRGKCVAGSCQCRAGYMGDGKDKCDNVNECEPEGGATCTANSDCEDNAGGYDCVCQEGFMQDPASISHSCIPLPRTCEDIRVANPEAKSGSYLLDPDGAGGCKPFTVACEMRENMGIMVIPSDSQTPRPVSSTDTSAESDRRTVRYTKTAEQIQCILDASQFCYQNVLYMCDGGAKLDGVSSWTDSDGEDHPVVMCWCGMLGTCATPGSKCNCDGTYMGDESDAGRVINKNDLPMTSFNVAGVGTGQKAATAVGSVMCGPKQFDIPKDCDDAMRNYGITEDMEMYIDVDGADGDAAGNLAPFLVFCDMTSYPETGVTVIPNELPDEVIPTNPGEIPVNYPVPDEAIRKLIETSEYCSQDMSYMCKNSALMDSGSMDGFWNSLGGTTQEYWAGGLGGQYMCGCGVTRSCELDTVRCNCDIQDGIERKDFGIITDKDHLPVGSVTLNDIDADSSGKVSVGPIRCGQRQFGIPPTCQHWREMGYTEDYTYLIDPKGPLGDGVTNQEPFPVTCDMIEDRPIGITVVGHDNEDETTVDDQEPPGSYGQDITYTEATPDQLQDLTDVSSYCTQEMTISCIQATLRNADDANSPNAYWVDNTGTVRQYFSGSGVGGDMCQCGINGDCQQNMNCNCDANLDQQVSDNGILTNKQDLPVGSVHFGDTGDNAQDKIVYTLGKLTCYALFETCHHMYQAYRSQPGQSLPQNGLHVIDPDGVLNEDPFVVECLFPSITIVNLEEANYHKLPDTVENQGPGVIKVKPTYVDANDEQLEALTQVSGFCRQYARYTCQHAPLTDYGYWISSDGQRQSGWAGNSGGMNCACGEVGKCDGGGACNCDVNDNVERMDYGWFIDKITLPVSEIHFGLFDGDIPAGEGRSVEYYLGALECSNVQFGIPEDCQHMRNLLTPNDEVRNEPAIIDPDQLGALEPFTVWCEMYRDPPIGITVVPPTVVTEIPVPPDTGEVQIEYETGSTPQLIALTQVSTYCTQDMSFLCQNAALDLSGNYGMVSRDGDRLVYWAGNTDGMGCANGQCNCDGMDTTQDQDGGSVLDKNVLPIDSVTLGSSDGTRSILVGDLRCSGLFKTCHEIKMADANFDPNWNNQYGIDPDSSGALAPFAVQCDFVTNPEIGITVVTPQPPLEVVVEGPIDQTITYEDNVSPEQGHQLAQVSEFCLQGVKYKCRHAALMGNGGTFLTYDGTQSNQFAGADNSNIAGCACVLLGTCPDNEVCRCDAVGPMPAEEGDYVTNRDVLPLTGVTSDGAPLEGAEASFVIGKFKCGPQPFDLPKDCQEAMEWGYRTGEALIWPSTNVDPFLVFCDMDSNPGKGVTIVPTKNVDVPVTGGETVTVEYVGTVPEQIIALVEESERCYLPMKFKCRATKFSDAFSINTPNNRDVDFFASARQSDMCSCGEQGRCGGDDGREMMEDRNCNCDVGDDKWRTDAGVFGNQGEMPVTSITFGNQPAGSSGSLTLGSLYCVDKPIDLNECSNGFNDCHEKAYCVNRNGYYQCVCQEGYRGKGRPDVWANGRECYDDNECALGFCPDNSDCTNEEGTFSCTCHAGYIMDQNGDCVDIDECTQDTDNCHDLATCTNNAGSFHCECSGSSVGDGVDCEEVGTCGCSGAHCFSFDGWETSFYKSCIYQLADSGCSSGTVGEFVVSARFKRRESDLYIHRLAHVAEIFISARGQVLSLGQDGVVHVDGIKISLPYNGDLFLIRRVGEYVTITTSAEGMSRWFVRFDGGSNVDVGYPASMKGKSCGICGNYNDNLQDDKVPGTHCDIVGEENPTTTALTASWMVNSGEGHCGCGHIPPQPCQTMEETADAQQHCNDILSVTGRFGDCVTAVANSIGMYEFADEYFGACVAEVCALTPVINHALCEVASRLIEHCQELLGPLDEINPDSSKDFIDWKTGLGCEHPCAGKDNMEFKLCGSECPHTCGLSQSECPGTDTSCHEGCFCKKNYVLDDDQCAVPETCGCVMDGVYYSVGDSMVSADCSQTCSCVSADDMQCQLLTCDNHATCKIVDGVQNCYCNEGFMGDGVNCDDNDECGETPSPCVENSDCANSPGSYECACKDGFFENGTRCDNINECLTSDHDCDLSITECRDTEGSFSCPCKLGFRMNFETNLCEDVNECDGRDNCDRVSTDCNNVLGSFTCECKEGYERMDPTECKDINECDREIDDCHEHATCANRDPGFDCYCNYGYSGNGKYCEDVDECTLYSIPCPGGHVTCVDDIGTYNCICDDNFEMKYGDDKCTDIDECADANLNNCDAAHSKCENDIGTFDCSCESGYEGNGVDSCTDIKECDLVVPVCGSHSSCTEEDGSYSCACHGGYESPTNNGKNCDDIDECEKKTDGCDENAGCANTDGSYTCSCRAGYSGNGKMCDDNDECTDDSQNDCGDNSQCENNIGSYDCICNKGYTMSGTVCIDVNECNNPSLNNCDDSAKCENIPPGDFTCTCYPGYAGSGVEGDCAPVNECTMANICTDRQVCVNEDPFYRCDCKDGFEPDGSDCKDIDECAEGGQNNCHDKADCTNLEPSFFCKCGTGYQGDGMSCDDINECDTKCNGEGQMCSNNPGSFTCICEQGYIMQLDGSCKDVDECTPISPCSENMDCNNKPGSYECSCLEGYITDMIDADGNPVMCDDIDECNGPADPCATIDHTLCINSDGGYRCECVDGYEMEGGVCKDVNECENPNQCVDIANCHNNDGSYYCSCKDGYTGDMGTNINCTDINECADQSADCSPNGVCENKVGSYVCDHCKPGYVGNGKQCDNKNECDLNDHNCHENANCLDNIGSFDCYCKEGYSGDGRACTNVNECETNDYSCPEHSYCVDDMGSYNCPCADGYQKVGETCDEINECVPNPCGESAQCIDLVNDFMCTCPEGYRLHTDQRTCLGPDDCTYDDNVCDDAKKLICKQNGDRRMCECKQGYEMTAMGCEDKDECGTLPCGDFEVCRNEPPGSFTCDCINGYRMNIAGECKDIDECGENTFSCNDPATCENVPGSYRCICPDGYDRMVDGDGIVTCDDIDECTKLNDCNDRTNCRNTPGTYECDCKVGFEGDDCRDINECSGPNDCNTEAVCDNTMGTYKCTCTRGFRGNGIICDDIDECEENAHDCSANADCKNNHGGFYCECRPGFSGHCDACEDINECATGLADCPEHSDCENRNGTFVCICMPGFVGADCADENECLLRTADCSANSQCKNRPGSYWCDCFVGYAKGTNNLCENINECAAEGASQLCDINAACVDTDGSYACVCNEGYSGDGTTCIDTVPTGCGDRVCHETAHCFNGVVCICPTGFQGTPFDGTNGCIDVDECVEANDCDPNADCSNLPGSYDCACRTGYMGDGKDCQDNSPVGCEFDSDCGQNSECQSDGSCACYEGFTGENGLSCHDINECAGTNDCGYNTDCYNRIGDYSCVCHLGYSNLDTFIIPHTCSNVDECYRNLHDCQQGCTDSDPGYTCYCHGNAVLQDDGKTCRYPDDSGCDIQCGVGMYCADDLAGGYECNCQPGLTLLADGSGCTDVNQCPGPCHRNANCTHSLFGGIQCECSSGYEGNGQQCQDVNECAENMATCNENAYCINVEGTFYCQCYIGYEGDGFICNPGGGDACLCGANGACVDAPNGRCECNDGFVFKSELAIDRCRDLNECLAGGYCHSMADCTNSIGSYTCQCQSGYLGDGVNRCTKDECSDGPCGRDATCTNIDGGGYQCSCAFGFHLIGVDCASDVEPCSANNGGCGANSICTLDSDGLVTCACATGYEASGESCVDIPECQRGPDVHKCADTAECSNFDGGHSCSCRSGYEGDGHYCRQINECTENRHDCSVHATCQELLGSYMCECFEGYDGDGKDCTLKPGCTVDGSCHVNAQCVLTAQSGYQCFCNEGYSGDGTQCEKVNECLDPNQHTCRTINNVACEDLDVNYKCVCLAGFEPVEGIFNVCQDIDECADNSHDCGDNSRCTNDNGGFSCNCVAGFDGINGRQCQDINECASDLLNSCSANADCTNTAGHYTCKCHSGYTGDGLTCQDINECGIGMADCAANTMCKNEPGTFTCDCLVGFLWDEEKCVDIDECVSDTANECDTNAQCTNNDGSYACVCNEGYRGNGRQCDKINPCDAPGVCHPDAICTNLDTIAQCTCKSGFEGDGVNDCHSTDECTLDTDNCHDRATCINTDQGFDCECNDGYQGDGINNCDDIDECDPTSLGGGGHECTGDGWECENTVGGYNCPCYQGWIAASLRSCTRIDVCDYPALNFCHEHATCNDVGGTVTCICKDGFEGDGRTCTDIDECNLGEFSCELLSTCANNDGGYDCNCDAGYRKVGDDCIDIDECADQLDDCAARNGICKNNGGSFTCICQDGFELVDGACVDINECWTGTDPCHEFAICSNIPGWCKCTCQNGYTGDGIVCFEMCTPEVEAGLNCDVNMVCSDSSTAPAACVCAPGYEGSPCADVDECTRPEGSPCHDKADCTNTDPGYTCTCKSGYRGNGKTCSDINECAEGSSDCGDNMDCTNLDGTFACSCSSGYAGDPCENVNECDAVPGRCGDLKDCIDTDGGFYCQCIDGYRLEMEICQDINECAEGTALCNTVRGKCSNEPGTYSCSCRAGFEGDGRDCTDVDECLSNPCDDNAKCTNSPGTVACTCNLGYRGDGYTCTDINECDEGVTCGDHGSCVNNGGSFGCVCDSGYKKVGDTCEDVNECAGSPQCRPHSFCQNRMGSYSCPCDQYYEEYLATGQCIPSDPCPGSPCSQEPAGHCIADGINYRCECNSGFEGTNGEDCADIDECQLAADINQVLCTGGTCVNTQGSFACECSQGYLLQNRMCININECDQPPSSANGAQCGFREYCLDNEGGYDCLCRVGYVKDASDVCVDINECENDICDINAECSNNVGSYRCQCNSGFTGSGLSCADVDECRLYPGICGPAGSGHCSNLAPGYDCTCAHGYTLVNNRCIDIDECTETVGICGARGNCGNLPGTYVCSCPQGYLFQDGDCENINECQEDLDNCHTNADCTDEDGSFKCVCRAGYRGDGRTCTRICNTNTCKPGETCEIEEGQAICLCTCHGHGCNREGKVCGSNGMIYRTEKDLIIAACAMQQDITVNYQGACKHSCEDVECPNHKTCIVDGYGRAHCGCHVCTQAEKDTGKVCTNKNRVFDSLCALLTHQCYKPSDTQVVQFYGECLGSGDCVVGDFGPWTSCSVTCGEGSMTKTREIIEPKVGDGADCPALSVTAKCYESPCENSPCNMCSGIGQVCVIRQNEAVCICPDCSGQDEVPVCGMIANGAVQTYRNKCTLQLEACESNQIFTMLYAGECGEENPSEPLNCSVINQYGKVKTVDGCMTARTIAVNRCAGGCGKIAGRCCQPSAFRQVMEQVTCDDGSIKNIKVPLIKECQCADSDENAPIVVDGAQFEFEYGIQAQPLINV